jgi:hypothetical protein
MRYAKILPNNEKLRKIIMDYGPYFEVVSEPRVLPQLKNQMAITLRDADFTFTTEVRNIRIVQPD